MKKFLSSIAVTVIFAMTANLMAPLQAHAIDFDDIPNAFTTVQEVWEGISDSVLGPIVTEVANRMLDKLTQDAISWATGGYDGEAGFINNYGELLRGTEYEFLADSFSYANSLAITQANNNQGDPNDPGGQAQSNWELFQNAQFLNQRQSAEYVAQYAGETFLINDLNNIVSGNAQTLDTYLAQSGSSRNDFNNNLASGGLAAYALLGELPNSPTGLRSVINSELSKGVAGTVEAEKEELSLSNTILSKKTCEEEVTNADGTTTCLREVTETPGDVVSSQLLDALGVDQEKAVNFGASGNLVQDLIQTVGAIAGNLVDDGLSSLTDEASEAFFNIGDANDTFNVDGTLSFQSEYDVLGITPGNVSGPGQGGSGDPNNPNNPGGGAGNGSNIYIGGPEDVGGWGDSPQIIIDLDQLLESNIQMAEEEKGYYEAIREETLGASAIIYHFDKCVPGPDTGWEERYEDNMASPSLGDDEEDIVDRAFIEMKNYASDPRVTIPSGVTMMGQVSGLFDLYEDTSYETSLRLDALRSVMRTLDLIKIGIKSDFNNQKLAYNENLVITQDEWVNLSDAQKISALEYAINNGFYSNPEYLNTGGQLTAEIEPDYLAIITNDEERARDAVISASFEIWRSETDPARKLEFRQAFHVSRPDLSNSALITIAKTRVEQIAAILEESNRSIIDCLVFKAIAVGAPRNDIYAITSNSDYDTDEKMGRLLPYVERYVPGYDELSGAIGTAIDIGNIAAGIATGFGFFGNLFGGIGGQVEFYNAPTLTDAQIKAFLEAEFALQSNPATAAQSVFKTTLFTEPGFIGTSILGFASEEEKQTYFDTYYPEPDDLRSPAGNKLTVKDMFRVDRMFAFGERGAKGLTGVLFCRVPGKFDQMGSSANNGNDDTTSCLATNYYASSLLDYELVLSGISTY